LVSPTRLIASLPSNSRRLALGLGLLLLLLALASDWLSRAPQLTPPLLAAAVVAGLVAWAMAAGIGWPGGLMGHLLECGLASAAALLVYGLLASWVRVPEMQQLLRQLQGQLQRRRPDLG